LILIRKKTILCNQYTPFVAVCNIDLSAKAGRKIHSNNDDLMYLDILQKDFSREVIKLKKSHWIA